MDFKNCFTNVFCHLLKRYELKCLSLEYKTIYIWEILSRTKNKYNLKNGCKLCNAEKIEILYVKKSELLNKGNELQTGCLHYRNQFI